MVTNLARLEAANRLRQLRTEMISLEDKMIAQMIEHMQAQHQFTTQTRVLNRAIIALNEILYGNPRRGETLARQLLGEQNVLVESEP